MASEINTPAVEPIKALGEVLKSEMGLDDGQIMLGNDNWFIPDGQGLYLSLMYGAEIVIGNNNRCSVDDQGVFTEIQETAMLHTIHIDVMSFNEEARLRKESVVWALNSQTAKTVMDKYQMRLASTPGSFTVVDSPEPAKRLNRFQIVASVYALHRNVKKSDYYDTLKDVGITTDK